MQRLLAFGARGGAGAAAAAVSAASPSTANCHAQAPRRFFVPRPKEDANQPPVEGGLQEAQEDWVLPDLREGELYFRPEEVEESVEQIFDAVYRPGKQAAALENASGADTDTDFSDGTESVGSEANMLMEEADQSSAPAGMQNVLINMLKQPGVQHACLTALMADPGFRDLARGQPLLEGANPARNAADVLIEEIDDQQAQGERHHPLAGLVDALGSQFAKLGEGLKRAGNTIGGFLVDMGYKLHNLMGKPMTTGRPTPDGTPVRLQEEWWARAIMTVACSIFVVMVMRRLPVSAVPV